MVFRGAFQTLYGFPQRAADGPDRSVKWVHFCPPQAYDCALPAATPCHFMTAVTNIAAYCFADLAGLKEWRAELLERCGDWDLKGTILLSTEGINLFVAGSDAAVAALLAVLRARPGLGSLEAKYSTSDHQPFTRLLVRIKKEIIAFGVEGIEPARRTVPKLSPRELKQWLDEGRPVTLLDTRNDYEVKLGTFANARTLGLKHFRAFPAAVNQLLAELKDQPIVMFCTGGIRCEKAGAYMEREGFKHVHQLQGGILKYFEECGSAHYDGECFVFDHRVGLDPGLAETASAVCHQCRMPLTAADQRSPRYVAGKSCPSCWREPEQHMQQALAARERRLREVTSPLPGSVPHDINRPLKVPLACDGLSVAEVLAHRTVEFWSAEFARDRLRDDAGLALTPASKVRAGQRIVHLMPAMLEPDVSADIRLLHEDEAIIVLAKPAPLPMHAGGRFSRNTLCHFLAEAYYPHKPRPAHRLDANTTGLVVVCRTRHFAALVQPQFERGEVGKHYLVRVLGSPVEDAFSCEAPISDVNGPAGLRTIEAAGLRAVTHFTVLRRDADGTSLLEARPLTGRTHQIRLHLQHLGLPVAGDPVYLADGKLGTSPTLSAGDPPLCLHAWKISFVHPARHERMSFTAEPPAWAQPRRL
jgi:RluA family pseudouridine synthase